MDITLSGGREAARRRYRTSPWFADRITEWRTKAAGRCNATEMRGKLRRLARSRPDAFLAASDLVGRFDVSLSRLEAAAISQCERTARQLQSANGRSLAPGSLWSYWAQQASVLWGGELKHVQLASR